MWVQASATYDNIRILNKPGDAIAGTYHWLADDFHLTQILSNSNEAVGLETNSSDDCLEPKEQIMVCIVTGTSPWFHFLGVNVYKMRGNKGVESWR